MIITYSISYFSWFFHSISQMFFVVTSTSVMLKLILTIVTDEYVRPLLSSRQWYLLFESARRSTDLKGGNAVLGYDRNFSLLFSLPFFLTHSRLTEIFELFHRRYADRPPSRIFSVTMKRTLNQSRTAMPHVHEWRGLRGKMPINESMTAWWSILHPRAARSSSN